MKVSSLIKVIILVAVGVIFAKSVSSSRTVEDNRSTSSSTSLANKDITRHNRSLDATEIDSVKNEGIRLYYQGKYADALYDLDLCVLNGDTSDLVYFMRGRTYLELGEYRKAVNDFTSAMKSNPEHWKSMIQRAMAYHKMGETTNAMQDIATVLRSSHDDYTISQALRARGLIFMSEGKKDMAFKEFRKSAEIDPMYRLWGGHLKTHNQLRFLGILQLVLVILVVVFKLKLPPPK